MFLYAKLVIRNMKSSSNLGDIEEEIRYLADGLAGACVLHSDIQSLFEVCRILTRGNFRYGRILTRAKHDLNPKEHLEACRILEWIGCATFPPRKEELLQAIVDRIEIPCWWLW